MDATEPEPEQQPEATPELTLPLTWRVHPAREQLVRTVIATIIIAGIAGMSITIMEHWLYGVLTTLVMGVMLKSFFLPSIYEMNSDGITLRNPWEKQHLKWTDIRRFRHKENRGYLSTRSQSSVMDTFSGMHLLFDDEAESMIALIQQQLDANNVN